MVVGYTYNIVHLFNCIVMSYSDLKTTLLIALIMVLLILVIGYYIGCKVLNIHSEIVLHMLMELIGYFALAMSAFLTICLI